MWLDPLASDGKTWRPLALHRVSAKRWCQNLDLQVKVSLGKTGLALFSEDHGTQEECKSPFHWPHLSIAMDLGSDGLAGMNFFAVQVAPQHNALP